MITATNDEEGMRQKKPDPTAREAHAARRIPSRLRAPNPD